ncbi:MAG: SseB family protein, partial [Acidobacteriota bacterium]|nr:SseB family protein [Acidobacteriota bacterium]
MSEFDPVNSFELRLRAILTDKNTLLWSFYTPLAAARLWVIVKNYPELDGSDAVAPEGRNPDLCVFTSSKDEDSYIGLYTAGFRAEEAFAKWNISPAEMT